MPDSLKWFLQSLNGSAAQEVYDYLDQIETFDEAVEEMMEIVAEAISRS